ncbi:hypothetical protein BH10CYA1_BH10CYA1_60900 [soil metagenome]
MPAPCFAETEENQEPRKSRNPGNPVIHQSSGHNFMFKSRVSLEPITEPGELARLSAQKEQAELLDLTNDAIIVRDLDGVIGYWNRGAQTTYGFTKEQAIGQKLQELLKTDYPKPLQNIVQDVITYGRWEGELTNIARDSRRVVVSSRWVLRTDPDGGSSILINSNEISAKKVADVLLLAAERQAEDVLAAAQQQAEVVLAAAQQTRFGQRPVKTEPTELLRLILQREQAEILDLTHDAIIVRDLEGVIGYWNRGAQETYGFTKEEAIGKKSNDLLKTEYVTPLQEIEQDLHACGRWEGELTNYAQDNSKVIVASRWVLKEDSDGRPFSILEVSSDVTLQKHAEIVLLVAQKQARDVIAAAQKQAQVVLLAAQQSRSDQRLRLVVEAAPNGMLMVDQNGKVALVNSQLERLFGYGREELLGQSIELLAPEALRGQPACIGDSLFVAPQTKEMTKGDYFGQRKDGSLIPVEIGLSPLTIDGENFVLAAIVDITERNRKEEFLQEKISELGRSNEELEQFAYVCSHDLQEPLRVISSYTQLLSKRYRGNLDEKADLFIDFITDASKRMQVLVNDLLVFSRLQTKAQEFKEVDCSSIVSMALANLKLAIDESAATITCDKLPVVMGDTSQLLQLFQNLVSNALKFQSRDSAPVIEISVRKEGNFWLFGVRDNGIGLDMQFADRIFVIFQRLQVKEDYPGSGIGLAVCKKIVQRHRGRIWPESSPGNGTTFYFTIPCITKDVIKGGSGKITLLGLKRSE